MSNELKNFASGKDWWYMDKDQAIQLLDVITDYYNQKLSENIEIMFEPDDITLYTAEIKHELVKAPEIIFKKAGIELEKK